MGVITSYQWTKQPQSATRNNQHGAVRSPILLTAGSNPIDAVSGSLLTPTGKVAPSFSSNGIGVRCTNGRLLTPTAPAMEVGTGDFSIMFYGRSDTTTGTLLAMGKIVAAGSGNSFWLGLAGGVWRFNISGSAANSSTAVSTTVDQLVICTRIAGVAQIYINGLPDGSSAAAAGSINSVSNIAYLNFGEYSPTTDFPWTGYMLAGAAWNVGLTQSEIVSISKNPWQLFEPQAKLLFAPPAASGVTGTVSKTEVADTSAASGTTTIVGTVSTTNGNDTSAAAGTTTVVGTSATTNGNDTNVASGTTTILGTVSTTNANDTSVASGTTTVLGTVAYTNENDTSAASGIAGTPTGTVNYTNNNDTCAAAGTAPETEEFFGGSGYPVYGKFVRPKSIKDILDVAMSDIYKEATRKDVPQEKRKEVAKLVKPFTESVAEVPRAQSIDWVALQKDSERVERLLELWQQQIEEDNQIILMAYQEFY